MKRFVLVLLACLLAGFCACGRDTGEEITSTPATTTATAAEEFEFTVTQRIHEGLPELTFTLHGHDAGEEAYVSLLEISGEGFSQRLDSDFEVESWALDRVALSFADYNRDGFLDLRLQALYSNNGPARFWLWDATEGNFIENRQLQELNEGAFALGMEEDGRVCAYPNRRDIHYYEYMGGVFVLTEQELMRYEDRADGRYEIVEIHRLVDGEMVLVDLIEENLG